MVFAYVDIIGVTIQSPDTVSSYFSNIFLLAHDPSKMYGHSVRSVEFSLSISLVINEIVLLSPGTCHLVACVYLKSLFHVTS